MMNEKYYRSLFSLITLTGLSFSWDVLIGYNFLVSFNVWSKDVYSKLLLDYV